MSPYRTALAPIAREPAGPLVDCPLCGIRGVAVCARMSAYSNCRRAWASYADAGVCCGERRVFERTPRPAACRGGVLGFLLRRCTRTDPHVHQRCHYCGARWTCGPKSL